MIVDEGRKKGKKDEELEELVEGWEKDDVGLRVKLLKNKGRRLIEIEKGNVEEKGDRDKKEIRKENGGLVEKRIGDWGIGRRNRKELKGRLESENNGIENLENEREEVREVEVNKELIENKVGDEGKKRIEKMIRNRKRVGKSGIVVGDEEKVMVRNEDESIEIIMKLLNEKIGSFNEEGELKVERIGKKEEGEDEELEGREWKERRRESEGEEENEWGKKENMSKVKVIEDLVDELLRGRKKKLRMRKGEEELSKGREKMDDEVGIRNGKRMRVGVGKKEIKEEKEGIDNVVERIEEEEEEKE